MMLATASPTSGALSATPAAPASPESHGTRLLAALKAVDALPANAGVRTRFLERLSSGVATTDELAAIAGSDPALAARVLRLANKHADAPRRGVETIAGAMELLGHERLKKAVIRTPAYSLAVSQDNWTDEVDRFRAHATAVQALAMTLARNLGHPRPERVATIALLHDIGKLVLARVHPGYPDSTIPAGGPTAQSAAERTALGVDHALIGGLVARRWDLPKSVSGAIETHHTDEVTGDAAIVRLADMLVHRCHGTRVPLRELFAAARCAGVRSQTLGSMLDETPNAADVTEPVERCPLTARQLEMIRELSQGKHYKEIAGDLGLSSSTIRSHLHEAYRRLGVTDRAQAVLLTAKRGWITPGHVLALAA